MQNSRPEFERPSLDLFLGLGLLGRCGSFGSRFCNCFSNNLHHWFDSGLGRLFCRCFHGCFGFGFDRTCFGRCFQGRFCHWFSCRFNDGFGNGFGNFDCARLGLCFNGLLRFLSGHDGPQYFKLTWKQTLRHKLLAREEMQTNT